MSSADSDVISHAQIDRDLRFGGAGAKACSTLKRILSLTKDS